MVLGVGNQVLAINIGIPLGIPYRYTSLVIPTRYYLGIPVVFCIFFSGAAGYAF